MVAIKDKVRVNARNKDINMNSEKSRFSFYAHKRQLQLEINMPDNCKLNLMSRCESFDSGNSEGIFFNLNGARNKHTSNILLVNHESDICVPCTDE